jgi:hypothetical protein
MEWTVYNDKKTFTADPEIAFEYYLIRDATEMLVVALDFFVCSAYTYNDADGNHIGWLVSNMYAD